MKYSYERRLRERKVERIARPLKRVQWKYRNMITLFLSLAIAYALLRTAYFEILISRMGEFIIPGSFVAGLLYAFSLSVAPSVAIFYAIAKSYNILVIALVGALGCVIGDYAIFRFVRDKLVCEIKLLIDELNSRTICIFENSIFYKLFPFSNLLLSRRFKILMIKASRSKLWRIMIWLMAGVIIASPLPDELGIMILGATNQQPKKFIIFSYICDFIGILGILYLSR
jgi:hypothetical protein